jgi:hypothetical protein
MEYGSVNGNKKQVTHPKMCFDVPVLQVPIRQSKQYPAYPLYILVIGTSTDVMCEIIVGEKVDRSLAHYAHYY